MSRRLPSPIPFALAISTIAVLAPTAPVQAGSFWGGWFVTERPVVYRPIVTPRTYYFAPARTVEISPAPRQRDQTRHPHHRRH